MWLFCFPPGSTCLVLSWLSGLFFFSFMDGWQQEAQRSRLSVFSGLERWCCGKADVTRPGFTTGEALRPDLSLAQHRIDDSVSCLAAVSRCYRCFLLSTVTVEKVNTSNNNNNGVRSTYVPSLLCYEARPRSESLLLYREIKNRLARPTDFLLSGPVPVLDIKSPQQQTILP